MGEYLMRLAIVLPIVCGLAWGSLLLWKRFQGGMPAHRQSDRAVRIVDAVSMGQSGRLVVVAFAGRTLLLSATRGQIVLIADGMKEGNDA
jgi:flagellar protein FliO/FliZ